MSINKRIDKIVIVNFIAKVTRLIVSVIMSCIIWIGIGHFVPELKELVPNFFIFTEKILGIFNELAGLACKVLP